MTKGKKIIDMFFSLNPDQIIDGIDSLYDIELADKLYSENDDAIFVYLDTKLQEIAFLWMECGKDELLTRLSYDSHENI